MILEAKLTWDQLHRVEEHEFHLRGLRQRDNNNHKETTRAQMLVLGREKALTETKLFAETAIRGSLNQLMITTW